ncbi:WD repeat-containing protein 53 [Gossypium australe]|uniref:WD repeat-containing protein 53 n=1 Tax=Gossypium australe TaxID=47621 RepID=A0A5B6WLJ9_9ROSI|nr:WD repeat-containing protein 53 [Gossypium australe]
MTEPRRLRGHKATATCCIASRDKPGLVTTSGEDGCICWFDMRCKDVNFVMDVSNEPISSLCFNSGNENIIYVSTGNEVKCFDVHMLADNSWKPLESYNYNKEEINQVTCNSRSSFLASADDGGEIKIIDIRQKRIFKTLRAGHTSVSLLFKRFAFSFCICSSVQFIPWRPWESRSLSLVHVHFSYFCPFTAGLPDMRSGSNAGQCLNPAFVHSVKVPDVDMLDKIGKICVVARGDGVIDVINTESELTATKPKCSTKSRKGTQSKGSDGGVPDENGRKWLHLDYSLGGHTAAVSCVTFSLFGEKGKFLVSGGNDKLVKVWDCSRCLDSWQTGDTNELLHLNINLTKKVNWLCTTPAESDNLVVCDTTKLVKVYTVS